MTTSTTLKLPDTLKAKIAVLAKERQHSPHRFMLEALEREVAREERVRAFVREALASDEALESGGESVYAAEDVHVWLERLAGGYKEERPAACRK